MKKIMWSLVVISMLVLMSTATSINIKIEKKNSIISNILNNPPNKPTVTGPTSGKA